MIKIKSSFLILLAILLSACGLGENSTETDFELSDFAITPNHFTVPAGSEVTIKITNNGIVVHDFNIINYGVDIGEKFDDEDRPNVIWEMEVQPRKTGTGTFIVPNQPGTYQIICSMPGHLQAGMFGTLEVVK